MSGRLLFAIFVGVVVRAAVAIASPAPSTLIVLSDDELTGAPQLEALRAEAAVRGLNIEIIRAAGSDAMANALGQRSDVAAVLWSSDTGFGRVLRVRGRDERTAYAAIDAAITPRAFAAVASSLLDELPPIDVHVEVHVQAPGLAPPTLPAREAVRDGVSAGGDERARWFLTFGGLAAPLPQQGGLFAAHLGLGRYATAHVRGALVGHFVSIADKRIGALSAEVSWTSGSRLRTEIGGRAVSVLIHDEGAMSTLSYVGFGAGACLGLGLVTSIGTVYARVGADLVHFSTAMDSVTVTPSGELGFELPL